MPLRNLLIMPGTYLSLYRDVKRQRQYIKETIEPLLAEAAATNDGSLDEEDFDKIRNYYGFGVPAIVGEGICTLHGRKMTRRQRKAGTFQGALTGLYDDFFDKTNLSPDRIREMMHNAGGFSPSSSLERLFVSFLETVHRNLADKSLFDHYFDKVFRIQLESKEQAAKNISVERIREITFGKGGYSLLYYRSVFPYPLEPGEENALFHLGSLMQLGNDLFDVYKDSRDGIQTLPTVCKDIAEVRDIFEDQMAFTINMCHECGLRQRNIQRFLRKFVMGISRCFVCMDQLEKLQQNTGGSFKPLEYSREELICDMERPGNILSSLRYFISYRY